jgi:hypothetical protein
LHVNVTVPPSAMADRNACSVQLDTTTDGDKAAAREVPAAMAAGTAPAAPRARTSAQVRRKQAAILIFMVFSLSG